MEEETEAWSLSSSAEVAWVLPLPPRREPGNLNRADKDLRTLPGEGLPLTVDEALGDEAGGVDGVKSLRMGDMTKACVALPKKMSRTAKQVRGDQRFLGPPPTNMRVFCDGVYRKGAVGMREWCVGVCVVARKSSRKQKRSFGVGRLA